MTPEKILLERHGFDKSTMNKPSGLMWFAVYQAMEAYLEEYKVAERKEQTKYDNQAFNLMKSERDELIDALGAIIKLWNDYSESTDELTNPYFAEATEIAERLVASHEGKTVNL